MAKQLIPRVTPQQLRDMPDQVSMILNQIIDRLNAMDK